MVKLSSTSALVMLWAQHGCYRTPAATEYINQLDLDEGEALYEQCNQGFRYSEVIKNRKFGVMQLTKKCIAEHEQNLQIVVAGAGFDALGIELTDLYSDVQVFELDIENMPAKSELVARLCKIPEYRLSFIEVDIFNVDKVFHKLCDHGWNTSQPTLLVLEGISYYLSLESIKKLVGILRPDFVIFEFLKRDNEIALDRQHIPKRVFGIVSRMCRVMQINKFDRLTIQDLFNGMHIEDLYSMMELETMRTGTNNFFPTEISGWIDVCLLRK